MHRDRRVANLHDLAGERAVRKSVHRETHRLAVLDRPDVGFRDVGVDLHFRQIIGDDEDRRRVHAGGDGLAHIHAARDDDAIHRRINGAMGQIHFGPLKGGFLELLHRLRLVEVGHGFIVIRLGDQMVFEERGGAAGFHLLQLKHSAGVGERPNSDRVRRRRVGIADRDCAAGGGVSFRSDGDCPRSLRGRCVV